jgi:hypothetical protein
MVMFLTRILEETGPHVGLEPEYPSVSGLLSSLEGNSRILQCLLPFQLIIYGHSYNSPVRFL